MNLFWWRDPKLDRPIVSLRVIWKKQLYSRVYSVMTPIAPGDLVSFAERMASEIAAVIEDEIAAASEE